MHYTDDDAHVGNRFSEGDPVIPRLPTQLSAVMMNAIMEELGNGVSDHTPLVKGTNYQLANGLALMLGEPGGRLCVSSGSPVNPVGDDSADVVYFALYKHNRIALWNGTRWELKVIPVDLIVVGDTTLLAANTNYDVFIWNNAGTIAGMVGPAWTSATARGTGAGTTEIERKDGRWVNKVAIAGGPAAQRGLYVGTIRTDGSSFVNDTPTKRHVWNNYNRVQRYMRNAQETTDAWAYASATIRQANGNAANQLDFVIGIDEDSVRAQVTGMIAANCGGSAVGYQGIGLDVTNAYVAGSHRATGGLNSAEITHTITAPLVSTWVGRPGIGRHFLAWLESSSAVSVTFYGDGGGTSIMQGGIDGWILA